MSKVIDSFLVALGFRVDDDSVKESEKAIDDIRTGALAMGAALAGAFVAAGLSAKSTATDITDIYNTSKLLGSVGVSRLDAYRHAFQQAGGAASDAESTLAGFEDLLAKATLGEGPFEELEKAGIPASLLTDTRTSIELFNKLAEIFPRLTDEQKKLASGALGLNRGADLLLRQGPDQIQAWLEEAEHFGVITDSMAENSEKLVQSFNRVERAWDNLLGKFTENAAEGISEAVDEFAEALNKLDALSERLGKLYGDNVSTLGPASAAATGGVALGGAGAAASAAGFKGVGGKLMAGGKFLGSKVALPLAVASLWDFDEDLETLTGWNPKDHAATRWLFTPIGELINGSSSAPDNSIYPMDGGNKSSGDLPFDYQPILQDRSWLSPMTNNNSQSTYQDHRQFQFNIDRTDDQKTADVIMERINEADEMARQQLQTATAG